MKKQNQISEAVQVPLVELLESVPANCREMIEVGECHHRNIPYGRYCQEAATLIRKLQSDAATAEVKKEKEKDCSSTKIVASSSKLVEGETL